MGRRSTRPRQEVSSWAVGRGQFAVRDVVSAFSVSGVTACKLCADLVGRGQLRAVGTAVLPPARRPVRLFESTQPSPAPDEVSLAQVLQTWGSPIGV